MTPHFQRSVVVALLLPHLATAGQVGPPVWPPQSHCLPTVTPGIAGAGQLEGHAGLGETPLLLLSGDYRPNYRLPHIVDKSQSLAVHPVAGAVASVVEALLWAETAD